MNALQHFTQVPLECESTRGTLAFGPSEFQISDFYTIFCNTNEFAQKQQNPLPHQEIQITSLAQTTPANTPPLQVFARANTPAPGQASPQGVCTCKHFSTTSATSRRELAHPSQSRQNTLQVFARANTPTPGQASPQGVCTCKHFDNPNTTPRYELARAHQSRQDTLQVFARANTPAPGQASPQGVCTCKHPAPWAGAAPSIFAHEFKRSGGDVTRHVHVRPCEAATQVRADCSCLTVRRWPASYGAISPSPINRQSPTEPRPRRGVRCIWGEQNEGMAMT